MRGARLDDRRSEFLRGRVIGRSGIRDRRLSCSTRIYFKDRRLAFRGPPEGNDGMRVRMFAVPFNRYLELAARLC